MKEQAKGAANTGGIERRNKKMKQEGADKGSNSRWSGADKREQEQVEWIT
jgi:hypothetical protein